LSEHAFLLAEAKRRATETIRAIESQTAAEVVVSVRHSAERHVATSLVFGGAVSAVVLVVMLVSPRVYDVRTMPLDALLAFALATLGCHFVPALRRLLTPKARRLAAAERGAQKAFIELGIAKTKQRSGILVFVALFERTTVVLADEGVPVALLGEPYAAGVSGLAGSVADLDFEAFLAKLAGFGPLLAGVLPRRPDDENELCDDVA
jgi:putative membrane protein